MKVSTIFRSFLATSESAELEPGPRQGVDGLALLTEKLDRALAEANIAATEADLVRATVLLWHDHFDAAHSIAQEIETCDGSYVHAILHRREPDYANAKYWFRRVGQHPSFPELGKRATGLLKAAGADNLEKQLTPAGRWDAVAFVDACEAASKPPSGKSETGLLREIQRIEFEVLLDHLVRAQS